MSQLFLLCLLLVLVLACLGSCKGEQLAKDLPPALSALPAAEREELLEGRQRYHLRRCVRCHGVAGRGDGAWGTRLVPPPRDFRQLNAYRQGTGLEAMAETIRTGVTNAKAGMPKKPFLTQSERRAIARYLVHMREVYR